MKKRKLRELEVSEIGMGTMAFHMDMGKSLNGNTALKLSGRFDYGCTFFDTAKPMERSSIMKGIMKKS